MTDCETVKDMPGVIRYDTGKSGTVQERIPGITVRQIPDRILVAVLISDFISEKKLRKPDEVRYKLDNTKRTDRH